MNYLINPNIIQNAKEIIVKLTPEEKALTYTLIDKELDAIKAEVRKQLFEGSLDEIDFTLNGINKTLKLIRGKISTMSFTSKKIDYDKAIAFAKEHKFDIPMTPRQVIEPVIDLNKLEQEVWFQNNVKEFVVETTSTREVKSNDTIRIGDKK